MCVCAFAGPDTCMEVREQFMDFIISLHFHIVYMKGYLEEQNWQNESIWVNI